MSITSKGRAALVGVTALTALLAASGCGRRNNNANQPPVPTVMTAMPVMPTMAMQPVPTAAMGAGPLAYTVLPGLPVWNNSASYGADKMQDGNPRTYWCSPPSPTFPMMGVLQFPAPAVVSSVVFNTAVPGYATSGVREVTVEALGPTGMPVAMAVGVLVQNSVTPVAFPMPTPANQLRITVRSNYGGTYAAIGELQVLGNGVPAATPMMPSAAPVQINLGQNPFAQINNALAQANQAMATAVGSANAAIASAAQAMGGVQMITWQANATQYRGRNGQTVRVVCPPGGAPGSVWGSGVYTDDSSICTAAVHAGRIQLATGGPVGVTIMPGMPAYQGSAANGVTTMNYPQYTGSFSIVP